MANVKTGRDWTTEETYWRENFRDRPYFEQGRNYDYYQPAYQFGYNAADRYEGEEWEAIESDLERDWDQYDNRGQSTWAQIKQAVRDAWDRVTGNS
jgi:hypothetical protein